MIRNRSVKCWLHDGHHIYYYFDENLQGVFITYLVRNPKRSPRKFAKMWKEFVAHQKGLPIYFATSDPGYIQNHCKFHGYHGNIKVYEYAA